MKLGIKYALDLILRIDQSVVKRCLVLTLKMLFWCLDVVLDNLLGFSISKGWQEERIMAKSKGHSAQVHFFQIFNHPFNFNFFRLSILSSKATTALI